MARKAQTQTFYYRDPAAQSVLLVGDFTHWQEKPISMQRGANGVWSAKVTLPPGRHTYRFMVDGQWRDDPECALRVPNPYGTQDSVREVPA